MDQVNKRGFICFVDFVLLSDIVHIVLIGLISFSGLSDIVHIVIIGLISFGGLSP